MSDLCWCGSGKAYAECHQMNDQKIALLQKQGMEVPSRDMIKTPEQIAGIRAACKINTGVPLGYEGFPKSVCTSINDQVCHGIPSERDVLRSGDIVNVDVSTIYNGYYADASRMFMIGKVAKPAADLVAITKQCLLRGIEAAQPWAQLGDIGAAVSKLAHKHGYSVVEEFGGHGVGIEFHEDPFVCHVGKRKTGMVLVPGMIFTIEPMINMGHKDICIDESNDWTVYTIDGSLSAQWEHQILITENGPEILSY